MALKNLKTAPAAHTFENPDVENDDIAVEEDTQVEQEVRPTKAEKPLAQVPAARPSTEVASRRPTLNVVDIIGEMKDRFPPVEYGEGVRLTANAGNILDDDKRVLGDSIVLLLCSWNERYVISPGTNGAKDKELARFSSDGVYTSQGEPVDEYLAALKADGYSKASKKMYVDLFGMLEDSVKPTTHTGSSLTVQLSPDSVKSLNAFRRDLVMQTAMGKLEIDPSEFGLRVKITAEPRSGNGNTWTRLNFSLAA